MRRAILKPRSDDLAPRIAGRILRGNGVRGPARLLPTGDGRFAAGLRNEPGTLHELVAVDVARAVGKDLARLDAHDELSLRVRGAQRIVRVDARDAVEAHASTVLEVDEEHAHVRVLDQVPHREVHAVAVVIREGHVVLVYN